MIFNDVNKVLILAPHPDDAEFGLGGTISKLLENNKEIYLAVFSSCEKSTPEGFESGSIEKELYKSLHKMGISENNLFLYDYEVRKFPEFRQEILEQMVKLNKLLNPDLVFIPSRSDIHQDHKTISEEAQRAYKFTNLLGYEMPWNNFGFTSYVFNGLSEKNLEDKIAAIACYTTQKERFYSSPEFVRSLATLRGGQISQRFAESFEVIRLINR